MTAFYLPMIDRRTSFRWVATAMAATLGYGSASFASQEPGDARPMSGTGYGTDPNLVEPKVTWSLTMSDRQRLLLATLADTLLPPEPGQAKPSAVGIADFIDEWVSAPYPEQARDRALVFSFLEWLDKQALVLDGKTFIKTSLINRKKVLDMVAYADRVLPSDSDAASKFHRVRWLVVSGYFTSPQGVEELRFIGNEAITEYPGPTDEAFSHLDNILSGLGLTRGSV